jgi:hypothetical protein
MQIHREIYKFIEVMIHNRSLHKTSRGREKRNYKTEAPYISGTPMKKCQNQTPPKIGSLLISYLKEHSSASKPSIRRIKINFYINDNLLNTCSIFLLMTILNLIIFYLHIFSNYLFIMRARGSSINQMILRKYLNS